MPGFQAGGLPERLGITAKSMDEWNWFRSGHTISPAMPAEDHVECGLMPQGNAKGKQRMKIKNGTALPAPSERRIKWFEDTYGITLPADYVQFLQTFNGGIPASNTFVHQGREYVIESFLPILEKPKADPENAWRDITVVITELDARLISDEDLVGMDVIPIATLFAGDFVCLDFREYDEPVVSVWDHESSGDFSPQFEEVAESFAAFIALCR
jgi:hypothetical protein